MLEEVNSTSRTVLSLDCSQHDINLSNFLNPARNTAGSSTVVEKNDPFRKAHAVTACLSAKDLSRR